MKKTSLLLMLSVVMILAFTGCLFLEKEAGIQIVGKKTVSFGASQLFEIKITSTSAGGVGDVFAKDAEVKSVKWDFVNTDHSQGSFSKTIEGDSAGKYTATFATAPGKYKLTATLVTKGDKTYTKTYEFDVIKAAPAKSVVPSVDGEVVLWGSIQKNDEVDLTLTLSDAQLSQEQLDNCEFRFKISRPGNTETTEYMKYGEFKIYTYTFTQKTTYTIVLEVRDVFSNVYSFEIGSFQIKTTKPNVPVIVGKPDWADGNSRFEIQVQKDEDVLYYVLEKKSAESDQYYFVYRGFASSNSTVKLYDSTVSQDEVTYRIYGVDGGQSQGNPLVTVIDIPNRPPSKAVIVSPSGRETKVVFASRLNMFWTNGTDPDLGDIVRYNAYIGESNQSLKFIGSSETTNIDINKQLVSGKTYYMRVDSFDSENVTKGDIYSFTFDPQINTPVITNARINMNTRPYEIDVLDYEDINDGLGLYTRTYEIEISRYASFNDSQKFHQSYFAGIPIPISVPTYVGNKGDRMFIRMRITYENSYMRITTNWSPATLMTVR